MLTVLCSSPSRTWNVCSNMEYMILPMPNDGSITLGVISSTVKEGKKSKCYFKFVRRFILSLSYVGSSLTVQRFLEAFDGHHVPREFESLSVCLDGELTKNRRENVLSPW